MGQHNHLNLSNVILILIAIRTGLTLASSSSSSSSPPKTNREVKVSCTSKEMKVTVSNINSNVIVYLDKLKSYPGCQPVMKSKTPSSGSTGGSSQEVMSAELILPLDPDLLYSCGTAKLENKITGTKIFYHKIVIEEIKDHHPHPHHVTPSQLNNDNNNINRAIKSTIQESVVVKCVIPGHPRVRRQSGNSFFDFPENFTESAEELIDYSGNITARAPLPLLNIGVRQNGEFVDTALNVSPGTPLELVVYLDEVSAQVYGLLASFLRVTDNTPRKQEEIIILNGCSIDPYIFANFETEDSGKSLSAKFRAFKFPDTNYVLFVGTVNVCIKSCLPVLCGDGQFGYGRRKRETGGIGPDAGDSPLPSGLPASDPNKVFEAELTAFIQVGYNRDVKSLPLHSSYQPSTSAAAASASSASSSSKASGHLSNSLPVIIIMMSLLLPSFMVMFFSCKTSVKLT